MPRDLKTEETVHLARWLADCETIHSKPFRDPDKDLRDLIKDMNQFVCKSLKNCPPKISK